MQEDDLHAKPVIGEFPFVRLGMMVSFEKLGHTVNSCPSAGQFPLLLVYLLLNAGLIGHSPFFQLGKA
jgi:hypothetical protein